MSAFEPVGTRFYSHGKEHLLITEGHSKGWLCYRHPDGQWVTLRIATEEDKKVIQAAVQHQDESASTGVKTAASPAEISPTKVGEQPAQAPGGNRSSV